MLKVHNVHTIISQTKIMQSTRIVSKHHIHLYMCKYKYIIQTIYEIILKFKQVLFRKYKTQNLIIYFKVY